MVNTFVDHGECQVEGDVGHGEVLTPLEPGLKSIRLKLAFVLPTDPHTNLEDNPCLYDSKVHFQDRLDVVQDFEPPLIEIAPCEVEELAQVYGQKCIYVEEKQHNFSPLFFLDDHAPNVDRDEDLKGTIDNHVDPKDCQHGFLIFWSFVIVTAFEKGEDEIYHFLLLLFNKQKQCIHSRPWGQRWRR